METHRQTSSKIRQSLRHITKLPFIALLRIYRFFISPLLGPRCRFEPTCSNYCEQALDQYGVIKGLSMSIKRLIKCHPWHEGGYDPIPKDTDQDKNC